MDQTALATIIILVMGSLFWVGFKLKMPVGITMVLASIGAMMVGGFGLPFRHLGEGGMYFLNLMAQIVTGMFFVKVMEASGALNAIARTTCAKTARHPYLLLAILAVFVMFPAMLTGSTPVSVLTTGVLVYQTLLRTGMPKLEIAAIISMAALAGQSAPPVNVMIMIICTSTFMPYEGFTLPLVVMTFPQAILSAWYFGRKYVKTDVLLKMAEEDREAGNLVEGWQLFKIFIPFMVLVIMMVVPIVAPFAVPDPNIPFMFVVCAIVSMFTGVKKINFFKTSLDTVDSGLGVLCLFVGMGILVHVMSLTGAKGLFATTVVALPLWALYISTAFGPPLLGGPVVPFGVSAILGPPLVLAFAAKNSIIVTSAISMLLSLGCLVPPTALSSLFAGEIVGIPNYLIITRRCWLPASISLVGSILVIMYADPIAKLFGLQ